MHASNNNFLNDLLPSVIEISFSLFTLFKMISIVFFNGTFENNDSTSKDTKVYSSLI